MELVLGPWLSLVGEGDAPAPLDDAVLMARYAGGDMAAFEQLYRRHKGALYRYIVRFAPARADADEVFQEVWMAVIKGRERYAPTARFTTFLFAIAHRRIADRHRLAARRPQAPLPPELDDGLPNPAELAQSGALAAALSAAVNTLPPEQRVAFLLRAEGDLSVEEIAEVTGVPYETAKSRLRAANRALREKLESWK